MVDISIVIPTRNEAANIRQCLKMIYQQVTPWRFEILVIDSGSTDDTIRLVQEFSQVQLIQIPPEEFGHGKTRNLGARLAKGKWIIFLNGDAIPLDENWLYGLIKPFDQNERLAGIYSRHFPKPGCPLYMQRDLLKSMPSAPIQWQTAKTWNFFLFSTVSGAMRKEIWEKIPFQDNIPIAEDQEWAKNALNAGYKILYNPESSVYHSHHYSLAQLSQVKFQIGRSEHRFPNRFAVWTLGFGLALAGFFYKIGGDWKYILSQSISFKSKGKEIRESLGARWVSNWSRLQGWMKPQP